MVLDQAPGLQVVEDGRPSTGHSCRARRSRSRPARPAPATGGTGWPLAGPTVNRRGPTGRSRASPAPAGVDPTDPPSTDADAGRRGAVGRSVVIAGHRRGIAAMWVYAFFGEPTGCPAGWTTAPSRPQAEAVCAGAADRDRRAPAASRPTTAGERADVVDQANGELDAMVARARAHRPGRGPDRRPS